MSICRQNPLTGEWVVYAKNRKKKPYEFKHSVDILAKEEDCPFCTGYEKRTSSTIYQDSDEWDIRVFKNLYPAFSDASELIDKNNFYNEKQGLGSHEILVDTRLHKSGITDFSSNKLFLILEALQGRYNELKKEAHINSCKTIQIFKNFGPNAGMSLSHSHWQLMSIPFVSKRQSIISSRMKKDNCIMCELLKEEKLGKTRIIDENEGFISLTPFASRVQYEIWICPIEHKRGFDLFLKNDLALLAEILHKTLKRLSALKLSHTTREKPDFNICFIEGEIEGDFHWYLELLPRIGGFAGFELATESFINPILPEEAAKFFRSIKV